MLKIKLIKYRVKDGILSIFKLIELDLHRVIYVLESLPSDLLNKGDTNPIIFGTG